MQTLIIQQRVIIDKLWHSPTFTTWSSLATRSLNLVLLIPFILRQFTPAEISLWYLFGTVISLNLMIDLGLGATFTRYIAYAMGGARGHTTDENGISKQEYLRQVVGTQQIIFNWLTLVIFISLISFGTFSVYKPIHFLINPTEGWIAWSLVVVGTSISFKGNGYAVYLQGINKISEFRRYETLFSLASIITSALVLVFEAGLIELVIVNQFWIIASTFRNRWLCLRYNEGVFINNKFKYYKNIFIEIWPSAWRSGIGVLMSYGVIQSSSLIYAQSKHVDQVSSYLFAMRIMQVILAFSQAPFYSKIPMMAKLYAQNKTEEIIHTAQKGMRISHWTFVLGFAFVGLGMPSIMEHIRSSIAFVDPKLWAILGVAFFIERYGAMQLQLYSITNKIVWHIANGITGILYIIVSFLIFPVVGAIAFPISLLISYVGFYSWYSARKSYNTFGLRFWAFESKNSLIPFLLLILVFIILIW